MHSDGQSYSSFLVSLKEQQKNRSLQLSQQDLDCLRQFLKFDPLSQYLYQNYCPISTDQRAQFKCLIYRLRQQNYQFQSEYYADVDEMIISTDQPIQPIEKSALDIIKPYIFEKNGVIHASDALYRHYCEASSEYRNTLQYVLTQKNQKCHSFVHSSKRIQKSADLNDTQLVPKQVNHISRNNVPSNAAIHDQLHQDPEKNILNTLPYPDSKKNVQPVITEEDFIAFLVKKGLCFDHNHGELILAVITEGLADLSARFGRNEPYQIDSCLDPDAIIKMKEQFDTVSLELNYWSFPHNDLFLLQSYVITNLNANEENLKKINCSEIVLCEQLGRLLSKINNEQLRILIKAVIYHGYATALEKILERFIFKHKDYKDLCLYAAQNCKMIILNHLKQYMRTHRIQVSYDDIMSYFILVLSQGYLNTTELFTSMFNQKIRPTAANDIFCYFAQKNQQRVLDILIHADIHLHLYHKQCTNTALMVAAKHGYIEIIKQLIKAEADKRNRIRLHQIIKIETTQQFTLSENRFYSTMQTPFELCYAALKTAIIHNHTNCMEVLIEIILTLPEDQTKFLASLIRSMIKDASIDALKTLIQCCPSTINYVHSDGQTALMHAICLTNNVEIIDLFIDKAKNINLQDNNGYTALMHAIRQEKDMKIIQRLIEEQADLNLQDRNGKTALMHAIYLEKDPQIVQLLLSKDANPNLQDINQKTALMHATTAKNGLEIIPFLLSKDANPNFQDMNHKTILMHAICLTNNVEIIDLFIDKAKNINLQDNNGYTALMHAIRLEKDMQIVQRLIEKQADLNLQDRNGKTALMHAIPAKNGLEIIGLLLHKSANLALRDRSNNSALILSAQLQKEKVLTFLIDCGADPFDPQGYRIDLDPQTLQIIKNARKEHRKIAKALLDRTLNLQITECPEPRLLRIIKSVFQEREYLTFNIMLKQIWRSYFSRNRNDQIKSYLLFQCLDKKYSKIIEKYTKEHLLTYKNNMNETALDYCKKNGYQDMSVLICNIVQAKDTESLQISSQQTSDVESLASFKTQTTLLFSNTRPQTDSLTEEKNLRIQHT